MHHLKLEEERFKSTKPNTYVYIATSSSRRALGKNHKCQCGSYDKRRKVVHFSKKPMNNQHGRGKSPRKKKYIYVQDQVLN